MRPEITTTMRENMQPERMREILSSLQKDEVKSSEAWVVLITPEKAKQLLSMNTRNRDIKPSAQGSITKQMLDGKFVYNGESIIISGTGFVVDGQHRLWGCVHSGVSFTTLLVSNVDESVMATIDTGSKRTAADVIKIVFPETKNATTVAAATQSILTRFDHTNQRLSGNSRENIKYSNEQILAFYAAHRETISTLTQYSTHLFNIASEPVISSANIAAMIYLMSYRESSLVVNFTEELLSDTVFSDHSNVAKKLKAFLTADKRLKKDERLSPRIKINYIVNSSKLYDDGIERKVIKNRSMTTASFPSADINIEPMIDFDYITSVMRKGK